MPDYQITPDGTAVVIQSERATQRGTGPKPLLGWRIVFRTRHELAEFVRASEAEGFTFDGKQFLVLPGFQNAPQLPVQETIQRALAQLQTRGLRNNSCERCGWDKWEVDILTIPANSTMESLARHLGPGSYVATGNTFISLLSVACTNCGYTVFHSLNVLERPPAR